MVLGTDVARRYQVELGDTFTLDLSGRMVTVKLVGTVQPESTTTRRALSSLILPISLQPRKPFKCRGT